MASLRKKAAALGSATPRRRNRVSAVSLERVVSERYRRWLRDCKLSTCSAKACGCTLSTSWCTGMSASCGAQVATAKVAPAPPSNKAAMAVVTWRG